MKKKIGFGIILVCGVVLLLASACKSTSEFTGTTPFVYTNNINTNFEILGEVFFESKERTGYLDLLKAARNLYPDCDYVIDIMIDQRTTTNTETTSFFPVNLFFFFMTDRHSVETDTTWLMRGTAIRYR